MLTPADQVPHANADLLDVDALAADLDKLCKLHAGHERELPGPPPVPEELATRWGVRPRGSEAR